MLQLKGRDCQKGSKTTKDAFKYKEIQTGPKAKRAVSHKEETWESSGCSSPLRQSRLQDKGCYERHRGRFHKMTVQQDVVTMLNVYVPSDRALKFMKQNWQHWRERQERWQPHSDTGRPHSGTGGKPDKRMGKGTEDLNSTATHLDLSRADRTLRPTTAEHMRFHQDTPCAGPKHKPQ